MTKQEERTETWHRTWLSAATEYERLGHQLPTVYSEFTNQVRKVVCPRCGEFMVVELNAIHKAPVRGPAVMMRCEDLRRWDLQRLEERLEKRIDGAIQGFNVKINITI